VNCHLKLHIDITSTPVARGLLSFWMHFGTAAGVRYDTRCYFNVRSKDDTSQLNQPHDAMRRRIQLRIAQLSKYSKLVRRSSSTPVMSCRRILMVGLYSWLVYRADDDDTHG